VAKALVWGSNLPDLRDTEAIRRYYLSEVELGEDFLSQGEVDAAIEHLGSAIAVCEQPQQILQLQILSQSLPQQVFHGLLERLPQIEQVITIFFNYLINLYLINILLLGYSG
jgi:import receptor subunit TOM20